MRRKEISVPTLLEHVPGESHCQKVMHIADRTVLTISLDNEKSADEENFVKHSVKNLRKGASETIEVNVQNSAINKPEILSLLLKWISWDKFLFTVLCDNENFSYLITIAVSLYCIL
jgi:hypothetical protein